MRRWSIAAVIIIGVVSLIAGAASGQYGDYPQPAAGGGDLRTQILTAVTHARFAASAETARNVREHLTHVVNCLEGPRGRNYDQAPGNPCQGQGNGIMPDIRTAQGGAAWMPVVEAATDLALKGVKATETATAAQPRIAPPPRMRALAKAAPER